MYDNSIYIQAFNEKITNWKCAFSLDCWSCLANGWFFLIERKKINPDLFYSLSGTR